jgi:hypothetical protein
MKHVRDCPMRWERFDGDDMIEESEEKERKRKKGEN